MARKLFYAILASLALPAGAFAADMPVKAPVVQPVDPWSGFYLGPGALIETGAVTVDTAVAAAQKTSINGWGGGGVFGFSKRTLTSYWAIETGVFRTGIGDAVACAPNPTCSDNTRWSIDVRTKYSNPGFLKAIQNLTAFLPLGPVVGVPGGMESVPYVFVGGRGDRTATLVNLVSVNQWKINPTFGMGIETPTAQQLRTDLWTEAVISTSGKKAIVPGVMEANGSRVMVGASIHGSPSGGLGFLGL